jgi:hypothetical protein
MKPSQGDSEQQGDDDHAGRSGATGPGDARETQADEREARLAEREVRVDAWEVGQADRRHQAQRIMADAAERDDQADARDSVATTRDTAAGLLSFMNDSPEEFDPALKARRSAAMDRSESKTDRAAAAADRSELTDRDPPPAGAENDTGPLP